MPRSRMLFTPHDSCENTAHAPDPKPCSPKVFLSTWWLSEARLSLSFSALMRRVQSIFYQSVWVTQSGMDLAPIRVTDTIGIIIALVKSKWYKTWHNTKSITFFSICMLLCVMYVSSKLPRLQWKKKKIFVPCNSIFLQCLAFHKFKGQRTVCNSGLWGDVI